MRTKDELWVVLGILKRKCRWRQKGVKDPFAGVKLGNKVDRVVDRQKVTHMEESDRRKLGHAPSHFDA